MKLSEKILNLRKRQGMSQEELAEKLCVSRQSVSRWEVGGALPDAGNILQLSKLFGVSCDYLLNDERKNTEMKNAKWRKMLPLWIAFSGGLGNFAIYILSRCIKVLTPIRLYKDGQCVYRWESNHMDYSWRYFIEEHNLEFIVLIFSAAVVVGILQYFFGEKINKVLKGNALILREKCGKIATKGWDKNDIY